MQLHRLFSEYIVCNWLNPIALRKAKIAYNFGLSKCNRVKVIFHQWCLSFQAMLEDKLRETDWEVTQETIEEQVARESYLQWLRDNEKRARTNEPVGFNMNILYFNRIHIHENKLQTISKKI